MITLSNLSTGYDHKVVARNITAHLPKGQLVSLLGRNGVGKSTLMRTLAGFQPALGGQVAIDGHDIRQLPRTAMSRLVSIVLTERIDVAGMSVTELVALGRCPHTGFWGSLTPSDQTAVDQAIRLVGIAPLAHRQVHALSDGERQKALIAKALAQDTPVILLDEPTAFLDFQSKVELMRILSLLAHDMQKTVLLSTHDVELAIQLSDLLWLLSDDGLETGSPSHLSQNGTIARFFREVDARYDATHRVFLLNEGKGI